jgi:hypothetical protein
MKTYSVTAYREDNWWMVSIPELDGLTQAHSLTEADHMARSYISISLDVDPASFDIDLCVGKVGRVADVSAIANSVARAREEAADLERAASDQAYELAQALAAEKVTVRDIGKVLGVSYQRAHQLVSA